MAIGMHTGKRAGSTGRTRDVHRPMSEINVTPFVDVMLVLLVVFMVTAPLLIVGVPIDLPKTRAPAISEAIEPLVVSVDGDGRVYVQETEVELDTLIQRLNTIRDLKPDTRIFVRGDRSINYGLVMQVMARLRTAGFTQLALVAELPRDGEGQ